MRWTVLIPAKALPQAKSRLVAATGSAAEHEHLVRAMRADTVAAARAAGAVARVVLVADRPGSELPDADLVLVQSRPGLNPALAEAAEICAARWPDGIAALVADLPALRSAELDDALAEAAGSALAFVADSAGSGTTMLTAAPGHRLDPHFGAGSAERHALIATALSAGPGLRQDVDTDADLCRAAELGVGPHTRAATEAHVLCSPTPGTMSL